MFCGLLWWILWVLWLQHFELVKVLLSETGTQRVTVVYAGWNESVDNRDFTKLHPLVKVKFVIKGNTQISLLGVMQQEGEPKWEEKCSVEGSGPNFFSSDDSDITLVDAFSGIPTNTAGLKLYKKSLYCLSFTNWMNTIQYIRLDYIWRNYIFPYVWSFNKKQ